MAERTPPAASTACLEMHGKGPVSPSGPPPNLGGRGLDRALAAKSRRRASPRCASGAHCVHTDRRIANLFAVVLRAPQYPPKLQTFPLGYSGDILRHLRSGLPC